MCDGVYDWQRGNHHEGITIWDLELVFPHLVLSFESREKRPVGRQVIDLAPFYEDKRLEIPRTKGFFSIETYSHHMLY